MYELFILGELMDQPLHGYLLHFILSNAFGPIRQISWGSLYPLMRKLTQQGFVEQVSQTEEAAGGRERKVYRITKQGCQRFYELMETPLEYSVDYPDLFRMKFTNFHHVPRDIQREILAQYRDYAEYLRDHTASHQLRITSESNIPAGQRPLILRTLEHRLRHLQVDLTWIDEQITRITHEHEPDSN